MKDRFIWELRESVQSINDLTDLNREKILYILVKIRCIMEVENQLKEERNQRLRMYCDWVLHGDLTCAKAMVGYFFDINKKISELVNGGSVSFEEISRVLCSSINFKMLWRDLKAFLAIFEVEVVLLDQISFKSKLLWLLMCEISSKPINWGGEKNKKNNRRDPVFKQILALEPENDNYKIISIELIYNEKCDFFNGEAGFMLSYRTLSGATINIPYISKAQWEILIKHID